MKNLRDKIAVVTGAAGGIGRAVAVGLAKQGCHLAISDVNMVGLEQTAALVRNAGRSVCSHEVDVADKARMQRYVDEVISHYGSVNILVNNAGVTVSSMFDDHSIEDFEWILGINLWGVIYGCKFFLPHLKVADGAHIVNLSSILGIIGVPGQSSYCASKFAVRGFSEALQIELAELGIGVTSVHPGGVNTDIARAARGSADLRDAGTAILRKGVSPDYAAAKIIAAIKANRKRQLITREAYVFDAVKRVAPSPAQHLIGAQFKRMRKA